ncbi:MAG: hypothetical protein J1F64_06260 [Oscillospiraceae bacterium]|nr:hypothetical protein [Oscillospiraceae bacterium]
MRGKTAEGKIRIDPKVKITDMSPVFYGIFFEDINFAGDGGLYGELICNGSYEYFDPEGERDKRLFAWEAFGCDMRAEDISPAFKVNGNYAVIKAEKNGGIINRGFNDEGFCVRENENYNFSCFAKSGGNANILVRIIDGGNSVIAENSFCADGVWKKYALTLKAADKCANARLEMIFPDGGEVCIDAVSLFPERTFKGRKNGLREDIAQMISELKPKFMRFPGGCIVEGRSFEDMYNWKDTIGAVEERRINRNRWQLDEYQIEGRSSEGYYQSYGLGFYEYFLFCEDIGAKPVPVMNVGMTCQWHEGLTVDTDKLDRWIGDVLDLIEFANGSLATEWGAKRARMGHEEPFGLEYIGIGNEQWGKEYFDRYELFYNKIREVYPDIKLITSAGWNSEGEDFDYAVNWMRENKEKAFAVDEHFYKSPEWFLENVNRYDDYDRTMPKVFAGEYACHTERDTASRRNNLKAALCEAAFLTGAEKNSDHVHMTCYAPLLAKTGHNQWQPDLIWFDNESVYGTPSYYVQKVFSENAADTVAESVCDIDDVYICAGLKNEECIVKIVNTGGKKSVGFFIGGYDVYDMDITEISGDPDSENSHLSPKNIYPVSFRINGFANGGTLELPANCVYVIRIKK